MARVSSVYNPAVMPPEISKQRHPAKNDRITPHTSTPFSSKRRYWPCLQGHEWEARISSRNHSGCPVCWREKVWKTNRKTAQAIKVPEVMDRFGIVDVGRAPGSCKNG
jgi:hypothetical protein